MDQELAAYIDHTQLKPETSKFTMRNIIQEARDYGFASVCVNPYWVTFCHENLKNTDVKVCTVIGFPLGATSSATKAFETRQALDNGASEVDMVLNIGELKASNESLVKKDMEAVIETADGMALTKVIIETSLLTDEEKIRACQLANAAGADFVKTSTGFSGGGATVDDVQLMRRSVSDDMGVKASGGIRDRKTALTMIEAGATRIGASASVSIVHEKNGSSSY
ncbi:deoxyribose-phosphate aldolase [Lentibacillus halophilus]|uniref:Deoxyribose-phosphate aldolase n=1 Tax=Lentibacillus halophilus TaxID=295065 RepID=A0ABN0ZCA2_9BACI